MQTRFRSSSPSPELKMFCVKIPMHTKSQMRRSEISRENKMFRQFFAYNSIVAKKAFEVFTIHSGFGREVIRNRPTLMQIAPFYNLF